jgi:hypothetical protein
LRVKGFEELKNKMLFAYGLLFVLVLDGLR